MVIIGAGRGGTALMEIFANDPLVRIVGVADTNPQARASGSLAGLQHPRHAQLPTTSENGTGRSGHRCLRKPGGRRILEDIRRMGVSVIGGASAKFMWQLSRPASARRPTSRRP